MPSRRLLKRRFCCRISSSNSNPGTTSKEMYSVEQLQSMSSIPTIRPAAAADLPALQAIYAHHVRHGLASFETEPPDLAEMTRRFDAVRQNNYPFWVAADEQRILGYAYANAFRTRPAYRFTVEDSIYLAPDAVGRGLGRRLLQQLIESCTDLGFRQMLAVIGDSGNALSIALHRACGFSRMAIFEGTGWKFGRWVDTVLMQRALGPGTSAPPEKP